MFSPERQALLLNWLAPMRWRSAVVYSFGSCDLDSWPRVASATKCREEALETQHVLCFVGLFLAGNWNASESARTEGEALIATDVAHAGKFNRRDRGER